MIAARLPSPEGFRYCELDPCISWRSFHALSLFLTKRWPKFQRILWPLTRRPGMTPELDVLEYVWDMQNLFQPGKSNSRASAHAQHASTATKCRRRRSPNHGFLTCPVLEIQSARQFRTLCAVAEDPQLTLKLLNDQEIADAAKDPEGMAVIQDVPLLHAHLVDSELGISVRAHEACSAPSR